MSKPRDIKKGLQGLQLNQAMKLKGGSLSLSPPVAVVTGVTNPPADIYASMDKNSAMDGNLSRNQNISQTAKLSMGFESPTDGNRTEVTKSTEALDLSRDKVLTQDRNSSLDMHLSQSTSSTRDISVSLDFRESADTSETSDRTEPRIKRGDGSRKATEQDSAVVLAKRESSGLRTGFTRISNEMLLDMLEGDLSKSEIKILLLISRFTTSFQKEFAPLSKAVIERYTRLQGKSVLDAMGGLEEKQLIQKRKGDERSPNQLGLAKKYAVGDAKNTQSKKPSGDDFRAQGNSCAGDNFSSHFKDSNKYINKYSLSQTCESLKTYFENLKPKAKRDEEVRNFGELKSDFSEEQIQLCLEYLQKHGSLKTGEVCHSPMAYLAKAIGQVLPLAQEAIEKAQNTARREAAFQHEQELKRREEAESERLMQEAHRAFAERFPSPEQQEKELSELISKHFASSVVPRSLLSRIAIQRWFEVESRNGI